MLIITLLVLLLAALCYIAYLLGARHGRTFEANDNTRAWNDGFAEARRFYESDELMHALADANELCRSAKSIADRDGKETNWDAWRNRLQTSLDQQHAFLSGWRHH